MVYPTFMFFLYLGGQDIWETVKYIVPIMIALIEFYFLGKSLIMKVATLKPLQSFAHYNITLGMMNELKRLL